MLQDTLWIRRLSSDLNSMNLPSTPFYVDKNGVIEISKHTGKNKRRKQIDIKTHHLQHHLKEKYRNTFRITTIKNIADILTKPLRPVRKKFLLHSTNTAAPSPI